MWRNLVLLVIAVLVFSAFAAAQTTWANLDDVTGWHSCGTPGCAGGKNTANFFGPVHVGSPSLDLNGSAKFGFNSPNPSYSDALYWYNTVCCTAGISAPYTSFAYDLFYYIKYPSVPQALQWHVVQTISHTPSSTQSTRYTYGFQCLLKGVTTPVWRVYDYAKPGWVSTGISCAAVKSSSYTWDHLHFEAMRTSTGKVLYLSLSYNGQTYPLNILASPKTLNTLADDLNVAFEIDSNSSGTPFSVWLDEISLTAQ